MHAEIMMSGKDNGLGDESISGKTVIVTGGGYGIGKQIALAFGRLGANVIVAARSLDTDPLSLRIDISSESDVRSMVDQIVEKYQSIDVLVNNSAISGPTAMVPDIELDEWRETVDINLNGTFFCCKYVSRVMREAKSGNIVTLSSVAGRTAYPLRPSQPNLAHMA
jgi:NAD(P)-dependent dehydrogenase (short-subunit alcohol dehydrogenase family)